MLLDDRKHVYSSYYDKCCDVVENWNKFIKDSVPDEKKRKIYP